jgi:outer membrane receptor protein involved in Fe transport
MLDSMRSWRLVAGLALTLAAAAQAPAVRGVVTAGNGLPIGGAVVSASGTAARTDAAGDFTLPSAAVTVQVAAPGYLTTTARVRDGAVRIVLRPAPLAESVTVTATAGNQNVAAVPISTVVMGAARIQTAAPVNADSLLRQFSDLGTFRQTSSLSAHPTTQGVSLLGTGSSGASRALVLLDGLPLNDFYGGWVDWLRVPDAALDTMTVVSGGASPLYGNDALSGVIGLETRAPTATHLDLRAGGGGLGTGLGDGSGVIAGRTLALAVRGRGVRVGGYVPAADPGAVDNHAGVTAQDWAPVLRWTPTPRALFALSSEYFAEDRHNGTVLTVNGTRLRQLALRGIVSSHGTWDGSLFGQSEDFHSTFSSVAAGRNSEKLVLMQQVPSHAWGGGLDWSTGGPRWSLLAGGSFTQIAAVDSETTPPFTGPPARQENGRQKLAGGFAAAGWSPFAAWHWTATLRRDGWRNYGAFQSTPAATTAYPDRSSSAWSPSLGTVWTARSWLAVRASAYESFRAPTLNELYRPFRVGNVQTLANPLLAAERYRGAQAGLEATLARGLRLDATYFDGTVANLVTSVTLSTTPTLITRQRQNLGRVRPRGEMLDAQWTPAWRALPGLTLWSSYTHTAARVLDAAQPALIGLVPAHTPANNFSARALATPHGWTVSVTERAGGRSFDDDQNQFLLPAFWSTDLYLSHPLPIARALRLAPYLAIENLTNRRFAVELTPDALLSSPRSLTAGLHLAWGKE